MGQNNSCSIYTWRNTVSVQIKKDKHGDLNIINRWVTTQCNQESAVNDRKKMNHSKMERWEKSDRPSFCCSKLQRSWWTLATLPAHLTRRTSHSSDKLKLHDSVKTSVSIPPHTITFSHSHAPSKWTRAASVNQYFPLINDGRIGQI